MLTTKLCTRKFNKETYTFYLHEPSYVGETGVCGIEISPYISVITPENCFGYADKILLNNNGKAYTLNKYLQPWILKQIENKMRELYNKYIFERFVW